MLKSDYEDSSDNKKTEKIQEFTKFDENLLNRCCNLLTCIDKNRDILQA